MWGDRCASIQWVSSRSPRVFMKVFISGMEEKEYRKVCTIGSSSMIARSASSTRIISMRNPFGCLMAVTPSLPGAA